MRTKRKAWSPEELLIVFRLYCRTPFGRLHDGNPEIIELAGQIGRTPGAVAMKACNFASLDPQQQARGIKALGNVSRADRELWEAFLDNSEIVAQEAEAAYSVAIGVEVEGYLLKHAHPAKMADRNRSKENTSSPDELRTPDGPTEQEIPIKVRRVQSFFRAAVLTSYESCCALTGLAIPELLVASHIVPWSVDERRRADPRNGICLNAFHDRAFDRGLISFDENFHVIVSTDITTHEDCAIHRQQLVEIAGRSMRLPVRFLPEATALEYHRKHVFRS